MYIYIIYIEGKKNQQFGKSREHHLRAAVVTHPFLHLTLFTWHSILDTLHSRLQTLYSTFYTLHSTFESLHCTHGTLHSDSRFRTWVPHSTLHSTLQTLHSTLNTSHFPLDTPHSTLYTAHCTLDTLHSRLYTRHSTLHAVHIRMLCTLHTPHFRLYTLDFTLHTLHSTLHTSHCTLHNYTPHSTRHNCKHESVQNTAPAAKNAWHPTHDGSSPKLRLPRKMNMEVSKALCLPQKMQIIVWKPCNSIVPVTKNDFWHVMKHVGMSRSAMPATRNDVAHRFCSAPHRHGQRVPAAVVPRTVADTIAASRKHRSTPRRPK